jgi:Protein of unknown function (DUF3040)
MGRGRRVLADLEAATRREDPGFADGLRDGRPVPPREYRERGRPLALTVLATVQVFVLIVGWYPLVVVAGIAVLVRIVRQR